MKIRWTIVRAILSSAVLLGTVFAPTRTVIFTSALTALAASPAPDAKTVLKQLIEGARKEGQVDLFLEPTGSQQVVQSFRQYLQEKFDLQIKINLDPTGRSDVKTSQAVGETMQGIPPTYDVQFDGSHNIIQLLEVKGVKRIDNLEQLLSEIAPQALPVLDKMSPGPFKGRAFAYADWIGVIIYNPKLISAAELPKTHKELADPKYKGMFALPPWTSDATASILVYNNEEALDIIKGIGANKAATEVESNAINRMLLGEFKFVDANAHYYNQYKAKDPNSPIGVAFFRDYTTVNESMYFVREGARHPNAATLFVFWTLSERGNQDFEKAAFTPSLYLPSSKTGQEIRKQIKTNNVRLVSFFDNEESMNKLRWMATADGKKFLERLSEAWRGGRK